MKSGKNLLSSTVAVSEISEQISLLRLILQNACQFYGSVKCLQK